MASLDGSINNLTNILPSNSENTGQLSSATIGTTLDNVPLVKKVNLTDEQKAEMNLLGMNPSDPEQVNAYINMSSEDKQAKKDALYTQIEGNSNNSKDEEVHEHVHNFQVDTNSAEWKNMSNQERINTFLVNGTKAHYSEDEWNNMTKRQQNKAIERFTEKELNEHFPNFSRMSETEQLEIGSEFLNLMNIADAHDMDLKDLLALKKNSNAEFEEIANKYYENNEKIDLVKKAQDVKEKRMQRTREQFDEIYSEFQAYIKENNLNVNDENKIAYMFEFLDKQKKDGKLQKGVAESTYNALSKMKAYNNGNLFDFKSGDRKISDLFDDTSVLKKDKDGKILLEDPDNRKLITSLLDKEFENCKTDEEKLKLLQEFDGFSQLYINSAYSHTEKTSGISKSFLRSLHGGSMYAATIDGKAADEDQQWYAKDGIRAIHKHNNGNISEEARNAIADTVKELKAEPAAQANVTAYELQDENLAKDVTSAIGEREDAVDVFNLANPLIANSENITDEMKQFYAQNSIEVLKSPEDRQSQANSLGKYNLDSFNKGVQKGYENIANGTASGAKNSSDSSKNNVITNPITNNSHNTQLLSQNSQLAFNDFNNNYIDGKPIPHDEAVKMFKKLELSEQRELLASLTPQQVQQIPITVCNSFPELIGTFIDLGKGIDIIQQCNVGTGNKAIQTMAKSKGAAKKQFNEWAANHIDRLAKCTYDDLVSQGAIQVNKNKAFSMKG